MQDRRIQNKLLLKAAAQDDAVVLTAQLDNGADLECVDDKHHYTPLLWAVFKKNFDIAKELVRRGAKLKSSNTTMFDILHEETDEWYKFVEEIYQLKKASLPSNQDDYDLIAYALGCRELYNQNIQEGIRYFREVSRGGILYDQAPYFYLAIHLFSENTKKAIALLLAETRREVLTPCALILLNYLANIENNSVARLALYQLCLQANNASAIPNDMVDSPLAWEDYCTGFAEAIREGAIKIVDAIYFLKVLHRVQAVMVPFDFDKNITLFLNMTRLLIEKKYADLNVKTYPEKEFINEMSLKKLVKILIQSIEKNNREESKKNITDFFNALADSYAGAFPKQIKERAIPLYGSLAIYYETIGKREVANFYSEKAIKVLRAKPTALPGASVFYTGPLPKPALQTEEKNFIPTP